MWKTAFKKFEDIWSSFDRPYTPSNFLKALFHKFCLVHSWIIWLRCWHTFLFLCFWQGTERELATFLNKKFAGLIAVIETIEKEDLDLVSIFIFIQNILILPTPCIPESYIKVKINLDFYFHTTLSCLKRFYGGLLARFWIRFWQECFLVVLIHILVISWSQVQYGKYCREFHIVQLFWNNSEIWETNNFFFHIV